MGCPYVYVLLLLVDEQSCLSQWVSRGKPDGKPEQRYIEKESRVNEMPCSSQKRKMTWNLASRPHLLGDTLINENGLI